MSIPKDAKKTVYLIPGGRETVTFVNHPEFGAALDALARLDDVILDDKAKVAVHLRTLGFTVAASEIEKMGAVEYEDFVCNNVD